MSKGTMTHRLRSTGLDHKDPGEAGSLKSRNYEEEKHSTKASQWEWLSGILISILYPK